MKTISLIGIIIIFPGILSAQNEDLHGHEYEDIIESVLSVLEDDSRVEEIQENFTFLLNNPVNINRAEKEDFNVFFFLSQPQVDSLIAYRTRYGNFLSTSEVYYVNGFNDYSAGLLIPFLTTGIIHTDKTRGIKSIFGSSDKSLLIRFSRQFEKPEGYNRQVMGREGYLGNPDQILVRLKLNAPSEMSAGFTAEKDKGEPLIWSPSMDFFGADHYSGHFALFNRGKLKNFMLGDYKISHGQGLVLGNSFYLGKTSETIATVRNKTNGLRPYSGTGESGFFRGGAAEFQLGKFSFGGLISLKKPDSRIETLDVNDERIDVIRGFITTGLHRTRREINNRMNSQELTSGCFTRIRNKKQNFSVGTACIYTHFDKMYREKPTYYNQFDFSGREYFAAGIDYNYYHRKINIFSEFAYAFPGGIGFAQGIIGNLSKNIETSLHLRHFSRRFYSMYGNPFRETGTGGGESGIYWGLKILPYKSLVFQVYSDVYNISWLRYNLKSPTQGAEQFARFQANPTRAIEFYFQFLRKISGERISVSTGGIDSIGIGIRSQYRFQFSWVGNAWQFRSRFQYSNFSFNGASTGGMAIYQEAGWKAGDLSIHGRITWFNADDHANRQYIFEKGALYDFQVSQFSGRGFRAYILLNSKISRHFHCWIKAGGTVYPGADETGTGLEKINMNRRTELLVQAEYKF
ncbi:MAG TPA: hypothetical protein VI583_00915 [Cyclobacteriaceae bacterium]|nr:hypothetical protein [Cyclobacteriaceae bacterium]